MVSAPERMFGHQLCKHLLSQKHTSRALESIGSSEAEVSRLGDITLWNWMVISHQLQKICCLQWTNPWFTPFKMRGAALSEHHAQNLHFSAPVSRCCETPAQWNNTRDFNPVDYKYEVLETAFLLHSDPCTWHDSTDSTEVLHFKVQGCAGPEGRSLKIKLPLTFFSFKYIFSWFFACRKF